MKNLKEKPLPVNHKNEINMEDIKISLADARKALEKPIALHRIFVKVSGSFTAGALFSQIWYWWGAVGHREFYKTNKALCEEIGLSDDELKLAKKKLINKGLISIVKKGIPRTTFYSVNEARLWELIALQPAEVSVGGKPTHCIGGNPPTNSENTQRKREERTKTQQEAGQKVIHNPKVYGEEEGEKKGETPSTPPPPAGDFNAPRALDLNDHVQKQDLSPDSWKRGRQKAAGVIATELEYEHHDACKVIYSRAHVFRYALRCVTNQIPRQSIRSAYIRALERRHEDATDSQQGVWSPSSTVSLAYKLLELEIGTEAD